MAIYDIVPQSALVGEFYGSVGDGASDPEYRAGVRWEPSDLLNVALTFGDGPGDGRPPGLEIGVLFYSR